MMVKWRYLNDLCLQSRVADGFWQLPKPVRERCRRVLAVAETRPRALPTGPGSCRNPLASVADGSWQLPKPVRERCRRVLAVAETRPRALRTGSGSCRNPSAPLMDGVLHLHITLNNAYERYSAGAESRPYRSWTPFCRCTVASISLMDAVARVHGHVPTAYGCRWQAPGGAHGAHGGRRRGGQRRPYRSWTPVGGGHQASMELRESRAYL